MRAVDTNLLVRWLLNDDAEQAILASAIVKSGAYVPMTVAMEVEWVLRGVALLPRPDVADLLERMIRVDTLTLDDGDALLWALERYRRGADWADCIHLISAHSATSFATFDRRLVRQAGRDSPVPIELI